MDKSLVVNNQNLLVSPEEYIESKSREKELIGLDIAFEIHIAKNRRIHYMDIMDSREGLASKEKILGWINDKGGRLGIVNMYPAKYPSHFTGGKWHARNYPDYLNYAFSMLCDERFSKKRASEFRQSVKDELWFNQASCLLGIKLVEDLYESRQLESLTAGAWMDQIKVVKQYLQEVAKLDHKIGREKEFTEAIKDELARNHKEVINGIFASSRELESNQAEMALYLEHKQYIESALRTVRQLNGSPDELAKSLA